MIPKLKCVIHACAGNIREVDYTSMITAVNVGYYGKRLKLLEWTELWQKKKSTPPGRDSDNVEVNLKADSRSKGRAEPACGYFFIRS